MSNKGASPKVAALPQDEIDSDEKPYEIIGLADPVEILLKLESDLGLMSNVLVAASYRNGNKKTLTSEILFGALRLVIERHPALSVHGISKPSPKEPGNHQTYIGKLKYINLAACTTFIDNYDDSELGMKLLFEKTHNEWFDMNDHTVPLWRLIVVNHIHVVFVWQHLVCDGRGGIAFHKSLLNALNKEWKEKDNATNITNIIVTTSIKALPTNATTQYRELGYSPNLFGSILRFLSMFLFRLWHGRQNFFFNDSTYSRKIPVPGQVKKENLCVTVIQGVRLDAKLLRNCLAACKKNQTTFTSLLATVLDILLATDIYPNSKVRILNRLVDLRRYVPQEDDMINLATTVGRMSKVEQYREAHLELLSQNPSPFWDLARQDAQWLQQYLNNGRRTPTVIEDTMILTPETEERFAPRFISQISSTTEGAYAISNLGAVDCKVGVEGDESWEFSAMEFSCSAQKSSIGSLLYVAVVSLKGGECMINVSYEKGVLPDEKVRRLVEGMKTKLVDMFQD